MEVSELIKADLDKRAQQLQDFITITGQAIKERQAEVDQLNAVISDAQAKLSEAQGTLDAYNNEVIPSVTVKPI